MTVQVTSGALNDTDDFTITVRPLSAMLVSVEPSLAWPGHLVQVNIQGAHTHFIGSSAIDFGTETWVDNIVVNSPTSLSATLAISWTAPTGLRNVRVTTGSEIVTGSGMFFISPVGTVPTPVGLTATAGATSIFLDWTPSSAFFVTGYNVYRDTQLDGNYLEKLNLAPLTVPAYEDTTVSPGVTYYYRVTAVTADPYESPKSAPAWATAGQIVVTLPDVRADAGESVRLSINLDAAWGVAGSGLEIHLTYDPTLLTPTAVEKTILTQDFLFADNVGSATGQLNIVGLGGDTLAGEGHILDVLFDVAADAVLGETAPLAFTEVVMFDWELNPLAVDFTDTATFTVSPAYVLGDVTGDGNVNVADAILAQRIANGELTPTPLQMLAGDITGEGVIDSADVTLILRLIIGLPINPPQARTSASAESGTLTRAGLNYRLSAGNGYGYAGATVPVALSLNTATGVAGCDVKVAFDAAALTVSDVQTAGLTTGFSLDWHVSGGLLSISMASNQALLTGSGTFCVIDFLVRPTAVRRETTLNLASVKLSGQYGENLDWVSSVAGLDGTFTVVPAAGATTWVDFAWHGVESGTQTQPFNSVGEGTGAVAVNGTVNLKVGQTSEKPRIDKKLRLVATNGVVRIGVAGAKTRDAQAANSVAEDGATSSGQGSGDNLLGQALVQLAARLTEGQPVREGHVYEPVIPYTRSEEGEVIAAQDSVLAIRLRADEEIAPESLGASVVAGNESSELTWQPAQGGPLHDVWVLVKPTDTWMLEDLIEVDTTADSITGTAIGPVQYEFHVEAASAGQAGDLEDADAPWTSEVVDVSPVAAGIGAPSAIGPERVYETPQRVWLPVPAGVAPEEVRLYYYHAYGEDCGWYPAENVEGWLVPDSYEAAEIDGIPCLGFLVRHAGIVQLGREKIQK